MDPTDAAHLVPALVFGGFLGVMLPSIEWSRRGRGDSPVGSPPSPFPVPTSTGWRT
jgi:hypothetical protein